MPGKFTDTEWANIQRWRTSGYLPAIEQLAKKLTAPMWWNVPEHPDAARRRQGGTVCIVHTGVRILGITAGHVHTAVAARLESGASSWCQLGNHTFDPRKHVIDLDEALDLAAYSLSDVEASAVDSDVHHAPVWPPKIVAGDVYIVGGWPWSLSSDGPASRTHNFLHFLTKLSDSTPTNLVLLTNTSTSVPWGDTALPAGTNLGGMSGGPIYRLSESKLTELTLVGIISSYSKESEYVQARPLSLVRPDGTIVRH